MGVETSYIDMSAEAVSLAMIYQINTGNNILHRTHLHYGIHTLYYILCICFFPYYRCL